jgi:hypothetical protein
LAARAYSKEPRQKPTLTGIDVTTAIVDSGLFSACGVEEVVEGAELGFGEVGEEGFANFFEVRGDLLEEARAGRGEVNAEDALVAWVSGAFDEAHGFGAFEEAGDVGGFGDEAGGDGALRDAAGAGAVDDAEDVVLRSGEVEGTEVLLHAVHEDGGGAGEVEQDFFFEGVEGFGLPYLFLEGRRHRVHCIWMRGEGGGCGCLTLAV